MKEKYEEILNSDYGIVPESLVPATGGFSTKAAYKVNAVGGFKYFLKVYDKSLPTVLPFVERIDAYMPALHRLSQNTHLHGRVLTPIKTLGSRYKTEIDDDVLVLFLYVDGDVPGIQGMTQSQTVELAQILALLHDSGESVQIDSHALAEDIALLFCDHLAKYLMSRKARQSALAGLLLPHFDLLISAIKETLFLRDVLRIGHSPLVLCHGDAHGSNVIQSNRLVLVDWEDLRLAPAEADLFIHAWHPHGKLLLESYSAFRKYQINYDLLYFYTLRRRIEDVWVDIKRLTEESPNENESEKLLGWVRVGIEEISKLYPK